MVATMQSTTRSQTGSQYQTSPLPSPTAVVEAADDATESHGLSLSLAGLALGTVAAGLTLDAMLHEQAFFDIWAMNQVQAIDLPYLGKLVRGVSALTSSTGAILAWAATLLFFALRKRWLPTLAVFVLPVGGLINNVIGEYIVGRTRPDPDLVTRTVPDIAAASFPSGHVMGAVMLYGLIFFLANSLPNRWMRLSLQVASGLVIAATGFARIWEGAHWPTDVLGAYAWGGLILVGIVAAYTRIEAAAGHLPFVHSGQVPHDESQRHAHALTSTVIFDEAAGTVTKVYNPGFLPRALYWLAFQAGFPYEGNRTALEAAVLRRNLTGLLTEYWFGENRVARAYGVVEYEGRLALVSEYVTGHAPRNRASAKQFLVELRARFEAAGLPTWQINPRQPRAIDNVLETEQGSYKIVDLESGLVAPIVSPRGWWRAFRRGLVPVFDDVYYDITRAYVAEHAADMRAILGAERFAELERTLALAEHTTAAWQAGEPRIWSLLITPAQWKPRLSSVMTGSHEKAMSWLDTGVRAWEREGRLQPREAARLRAEMETPQFQAVVPHLGAHVVISVFLRFPLGSMARASWSLWGLLSATGRLLARRIDRHTWRQLASIHSPLVIALAAIPGFGTFAYVASKPVRSNRLLVRVMLDAALLKAPWRLYQRSGLRRVVARTSSSSRPQLAPVSACYQPIPVPVSVDPPSRAAA
ncbi:MAG: hypothetical protein DCC58_07935 [Chloroflexi bacterium]|nr:MAG: hypothetical protein DCC58_07935 [Chloroflexota bacterium]